MFSLYICVEFIYVTLLLKKLMSLELIYFKLNMHPFEKIQVISWYIYNLSSNLWKYNDIVLLL